MDLESLYNQSDDAEIEVGNTVDNSESEELETEYNESGETTAPEAEEAQESEEEQSKPEDVKHEQDPKVLYAQAKDERRKRQELQRELEQLKAAQNKKEVPDVFDDQEGFLRSVREQTAAEMEARIVQMSKDLMRDSKQDYDEVEQYVIDTAESDPLFHDFVYNRAKSHPNPAKFIYEQGLKHKALVEMQDIDKFKARIREEVKAEYEDELKQKSQKVANLKPSLAQARASDKNDSVKPLELKDLFR